jgi:hypothetical protein
MSTLFVDTINEKTSGNGIIIPGHIIQVQSAILTSKASTTSLYSTAYVDTGLSVSITPKYSTSKVLITSSLMCGNHSTFTYFKLLRGTTELAIGDADGSRERCTFCFYPDGDGNSNINAIIGHTFLDSPATTSATTYKWTWANSNSSYQSVLNSNVRDSNNAYEPRGSSTITVMEIGG